MTTSSGGCGAFHRPNTGSFTGGRGGPWSEVASSSSPGAALHAVDTRPLLLTPPNFASDVYRPLFCWQPVAGAKKYHRRRHHLRLRRRQLRRQGQPLPKARATPLTVTATQARVRMTYYWRVWAVDDKGRLGQRDRRGWRPLPVPYSGRRAARPCRRSSIPSTTIRR